MLGEWRGERQTAAEPTLAPPATPHIQAPRPDNVVPLSGAATDAAEPLPKDVRTLVDRFAQQLHRAWTDALASTIGADDQMTVIRAAAEARVREALERAGDLEQLVEQAQARIVDLEHEVRTLESALAGAQEELDLARAGEGFDDDANDGEDGEAAAARIRDLQTALDAAKAEAETLRAEMATRVEAATLLASAPSIDPADPPAPAPAPVVAEKTAPAAALREALRSAEEMRDMMRADRDRLQAELDARVATETPAEDPALAAALDTTKAALAVAEAEKADALAARDDAIAERDALEDLANRQSKWIEQARTKLEGAGMLKPAAEPAETTEAA